MSHYPLSNHFDGKKFYNQGLDQMSYQKLMKVFKWLVTRRPPVWTKTELDLNLELPSNIDKGEAVITFIGHSTVLIQIEGWTVITDPVFSEGIGPFWFKKIKRFTPPALPLDRLPKIDVVLLSHNHFDHFDLPSIRAIHKKHDPLFIVPLGNSYLLKGIKKFVELDWWDEYRLDQNNKIVLTPAQHWSGRWIFDRFKALWGGFLIDTDPLKIFFSGDTGYGEHFKEIFNRFGSIDVSLLPIGAFEPRWVMEENHMNPEDAVKAHLDLHSKMSLGIHFTTFQLTDEKMEQPMEELELSKQAHHIPKDLFLAPRIGQTVRYRATGL